MKDKKQPVKSFQELKNIVGDNVEPTAAPPQKRAADAVTRVQCPIEQRRAGRAPYNFVPLPETTTWVDAPPSADRYDPAFLSGEIEIEIEALTDFYIRGMLPENTEKSPKDQSEPFHVHGRLRLPGSSLKGMIRSLVEIMGSAPLDPVNQQQLFYRAVAATPTPQDYGSFEPQAKTYKERISNVKAGYLYASATKWVIKPAKPTGFDRPAYRYYSPDNWKRERIHFRADGDIARRCQPGDPGARMGSLVCSRRMQGKRGQWVIPEEAGSGAFEIPPGDVEAYKEGGVSPEIERNQFKFGREEDYSNPVPCFYVQWGAGDQRVAFGHTLNFRMPYMTTTADAVPIPNRRAEDRKQWDIAQALFGRIGDNDPKTPGARGAKGRVCIEDGLLAGDPEHAFESAPFDVVLGNPKPTTYQHYLVQPSGRPVDAIHWDGDYRSAGETGKAVVRGHKLYWHRPGAPVKPADGNQQRVKTSIQVAHQGLRFRSKVRYENLRNYELGGLLRALELPEGCGHRLGMGKPLGLGSFRIRVVEHRGIDRVARYGGFFKDDGAAVRTGIAARETSTFIRDFDERCKWSWESDRGKELKALLTYAGLPERWNERTRYLEFGRVSKDGRPLLYNEYLRTGYPGRIELQKRRPLPPATQVLDPKAQVPSEPRPPFDGPALVRNLRQRQ